MAARGTAVAGAEQLPVPPLGCRGPGRRADTASTICRSRGGRDAALAPAAATTPPDGRTPEPNAGSARVPKFNLRPMPPSSNAARAQVAAARVWNPSRGP